MKISPPSMLVFVRCAVRYIGAPHVPDASDRVVRMMRVKDLALREGWKRSGAK